MKLLLKAALKTKRHLFLVVTTFLTLLFLSVASQMEVFALGVLSNKGADFFELFTEKAKNDKMGYDESVSYKAVEQKWDEIDTAHKGYITKEDAAKYLSKKQDRNPLNWILEKVKTKVNYNNGIGSLLVLLICVAVFKAFWLFFSRYATQLLAIRVSRDLREMYFAHIQSLPMSFYQKYNLGSLSSRVVGDASQIATSLNSLLTNYLQTPFTVITCLTVCFYLSWQLSLVVFVGVPLIVLPIVFIAKRVKRVSRQLQSNQEKFASLLLDFLAGIQTVKIFAMEAFSMRKYKQENDKMAVLESKIAKYGLLVRPILHCITTICLAAIVLVGLYSFHMTVSQLIVFCALLNLVYEPIKKFADENTNVQRGVVAAERMFEVLNQSNDIPDHPNAIELKDFQDKIEFKGVWFKYESDYVLKDLSFTVQKGQTVAVVGPTGAGKSTIVQLIPRLYDVSEGTITIDGIPLTGYTQASLREKIAFVSQKPFLFYDTIAENISFGRSFTREQVIEAAKKAHADEFIKDLASGYDTMLAEAGKNFSGGQQQRIAIARALVKKAPILILDEATSALDAISEQRIKAAIDDLKGEVTQIIIAHRLTTIEHADKIIYLEKGEKVAEGTKDELLRNCPAFRNMWQTHYHLNKASDEETVEV